MLIVVPLLVLTCSRVRPTILQTRMKAATVTCVLVVILALAHVYEARDVQGGRNCYHPQLRHVAPSQLHHIAERTWISTSQYSCSNCRRSKIANRIVIACVNYSICRADLSLRQNEISDRRQLLQSSAAAAAATANGAAAAAASAASTASSAAGSSGSSGGTWTASQLCAGIQS